MAQTATTIDNIKWAQRVNPLLKIVFALVFAPTALLTLLFVIGLAFAAFSIAESGLPEVSNLCALLKPVGLEVGALLLTVLLGWQIRHIE